MVKCLPAMWETRVRSLGWEDLLEKEMATHSSVLAWRIPWTEEPGGYSPRGRKESDTAERLHFKVYLHWQEGSLTTGANLIKSLQQPRRPGDGFPFRVHREVRRLPQGHTVSGKTKVLAKAWLLRLRFCSRQGPWLQELGIRGGGAGINSTKKAPLQCVSTWALDI